MNHSALSVIAAALLAGSLASVVACSGGDGTGGPTKPAATTDSGPVTDKNAPLDPSANDPVPGELPVMVAHPMEGGDDAVPDFSCFGKPLPVARGAATDREFHLIELGGVDVDRVPSVPVDLFFSNTLQKVDQSVISKKGDDGASKAEKGTFGAKTSAGWIAYRVPAAPGYVATTGLDLEVPESGPVLPAVATEQKVQALSLLIGGSSYEPTKGAGRAVVRIMDCNARAVMGAHVVLEIDGQVPHYVTGTGLRRSYFGDAEFPGTAKFSSRSGVVAFLEIPGASKTLRIVARGRVGDEVKVIAMRSIPLVADGLAAAKIFPFVAP